MIKSKLVPIYLHLHIQYKCDPYLIIVLLLKSRVRTTHHQVLVSGSKELEAYSYIITEEKLSIYLSFYLSTERLGRLTENHFTEIYFTKCSFHRQLFNMKTSKRFIEGITKSLMLLNTAVAFEAETCTE